MFWSSSTTRARSPSSAACSRPDCSSYRPCFACENNLHTHANAKPTKVLFESACSDSSSLGVECQKQSVSVVRLTLSNGDLSTPQGIERAMTLAKEHCASIGTQVHLHGSLPCTAWCRWHSMNLFRWGAKFRKKLLEKRQNSLKMLNNFFMLARYIV